MMKRIILLTVLALIGISSVQAQKFKNYLKKKKQVIEQELDRKADEKIRDGVDGLFKKDDNNANSNGDNNQPSNNNDGNQNTNTTDNITDVYDFDLNVHYDMVLSKNGQQEQASSIQRLLTKSGSYTASLVNAGDQTGTVIIDFEKERMLLVMESLKMVSVSDLKENNETTSNDNDGSDNNNTSGTNTPNSSGGTGTSGGTTSKASFRKTGKTATIAGYNCDHYTFRDEEGNSGEFWVAPALNYDLRMGIGEGLKNPKYQANMKTVIPKDAPTNGVVLQYILDTNTDEHIEMTATKVAKKKTSFDMKDYKARKMN